MQNLKKRLFACFLIFTLFMSLSGTNFVYAQTVNDVQNDLNDVEAAQDKTSKELSQVEKDIKSLQAKVNNLNDRINEAVDDIDKTEKSIIKKEKEMAERQDNLNDRLRVMYKNGSVGFVDVLLGSNSISEFISNLDMIQRVYTNDVEVLETLEKEHDELNKIKADLDKKKANLAAQKSELADEKKVLASKKSDLEAKEDELKAEADKLTETLKSLMSSDSQFVGGVFAWPCPSSHYITSPFGNRIHPILKVWKFHTGIDIGASSGKAIVAAADGKVILSQTYGGYGKCIIVDHGGGVVTLYGHASQLMASVGDKVSKGEQIAKVGSTGNSTGPHLHFEVRVNGDYVNPMSYF